MNPSFSCARYRELLPLFAAGHLSQEERVLVREHLATCAACRAEVALWEAMPAAFALREEHARQVSVTTDVAWQRLAVHLPAQEPLPPPPRRIPPVITAPDQHLPAISPVLAHQPRRNVIQALALVLALITLISTSLYYFHAATSPGAQQSIVPVLRNQPTHYLAAGELLPHVSLNAVQMLTANEGWAVGFSRKFLGKQEVIASAIVHYHAGRWTQSNDVFPNITLLTLSMVSPDDGWAGGALTGTRNDSTVSTGVILHYHAGHWTQEHIPGSNQINAIRMLSADDGWAVANDGNQSSPFLHYHNGVWSSVFTPPHGFYSTFAFDGTDTFWAGGVQGSLGRFANGQVQPSPTKISGDVTTISMRSQNDGWLFGFAPGDTGPVNAQQRLYAMHYDGAQWRLIELGKAPVGYSSIVSPLIVGMALTDDGGWAVGDILNNSDNHAASLLFYLANGRWEQQRFQVDAALRSISFTTSDDGWAVGYKSGQVDAASGQTFDSGVLLHYHDGQWSIYQP